MCMYPSYIPLQTNMLLNKKYAKSNILHFYFNLGAIHIYKNPLTDNNYCIGNDNVN